MSDELTAADHGPDFVRNEVFPDFDRVPRCWIRRTMAGCAGCGEWTRRRARRRRMHSTYRARRRP